MLQELIALRIGPGGQAILGLVRSSSGFHSLGCQPTPDRPISGCHDLWLFVTVSWPPGSHLITRSSAGVIASGESAV
jgi:hypothetical protein